MIKSHYNLNNNGHSKLAEMHRHRRLVLMEYCLIDIKGNLTMWKPNKSLLSYNFGGNVVVFISGKK